MIYYTYILGQIQPRNINQLRDTYRKVEMEPVPQIPTFRTFQIFSPFLDGSLTQEKRTTPIQPPRCSKAVMEQNKLKKIHGYYGFDIDTVFVYI